MNETSCFLIFSAILIVSITGILMVCYNCSDKFTNMKKLVENFSPTGWTQNCPAPKGVVLSQSSVYGPDRKYFADKKMGKCGPGCVYSGDEQGTEGCRRRVPKVENPENTPLGWGGTMVTPRSGDSGCASNVNGIRKMSNKNPYGEISPDGNQMYGFCVKGEMNPFDEDHYSTFA